MSLNNEWVTLGNDNGFEINEWMLNCPFPPSMKRQKISGYNSGDSWHGGRVELKFNQDVVGTQSKEMAQQVILQAYQRLHQTIIGEGLFHRTYTTFVECPSSLHKVSVDASEHLGENGDASCGRIGSIIPISLGYAMYGRIDNIQVLVQNPTMFTPLMDELVDAKVSMLRQATVSLGTLERQRVEQFRKEQHHHKDKLKSFAERHLDRLVARFCEQPAKQMVGQMLSDWECERRMKCAAWKMEHQQRVMDIEHCYNQKRSEVIRSCLV